MGRVNRLMTTSAKKKSAQTSRGKKEATDQIDEYSFFISGNGNTNDDALDKESRNEKALKNDVIESKRNSNFFLPE
jgi:hypothetical protein